MSINKHFRVKHGLSVNTSAQAVTFEVAANDAILIPRGTSGERPAGANGQIRYNITTGNFEGFIAGAWTALSDATTTGDMSTSTYDPGGVGEQLVGLTAIQTLTNKTLTSPTISTSIALPANAIDAITEISAALKTGADLKLVTGTAGTNGDLAQWNIDGDLVDGPTPPSGVIVGTTDVQTLTNKTLTSPTISTSVALPSGAVDAITEISSSLKSGADPTLITGTKGTNGDLAVWNIDGDLVDGPTPPTGAIVGTSDSQTLTNKFITSPIINTSIALPANAVDAITEISASIKSGVDGTLITGTAGTNTHLAQWNADGDLVTAGKAAPTGAIVGNTDTQTLTNKTLVSPTISTSVALPAGAVDAITEIASGLKTGLDTKLVTGTVGTSTHLAQWDSNGDLVTAGKAAPSGAIVGTTDAQTLTNKTLTSPTISTSIALPSNAVDNIAEISTSIRATAAQYRNNTADKLLETDQVWAAMAEVTLTDAASISWNMNDGIDFKVTLAGNRTLSNPTNVIVGKKGRLRVIQDATGSRTLAWSSYYKHASAEDPVLTTGTPNAIDCFYYDCVNSTYIVVTSVLALG